MKPFSCMTNNSRQKSKYLKNKNSFGDEIKINFSSFLKGFHLSEIVSDTTVNLLVTLSISQYQRHNKSIEKAQKRYFP